MGIVVAHSFKKPCLQLFLLGNKRFEHDACAGEFKPFPFAEDQGFAQCFFEFLYVLAYAGLGHIKPLSCAGKAAGINQCRECFQPFWVQH